MRATARAAAPSALFDHFQSSSVASIANNSTTQTVVGFSRIAAVATDPGLFTYATGTFTCVMAGTYFINASCTFASNLTGRRMAMLYLNNLEARRADAASGGQATPLVTHILQLSAGDTLELHAFQNSGAALLLTGTHDFQMLRQGN